MSENYRVCPSCGAASEALAYDCLACGASLDGTMPAPLPKGTPLATAHPSRVQRLAVWAAEVEAKIAHEEVCCHNCRGDKELIDFPFALADVESHVGRWLPTAISFGISVLLRPFGIGFISWKPRRSGYAFPMKLILCRDCLAEYEDFHGHPARDAYRLHPVYEKLENARFATFVSETEFKKWEHIR
jgi:hypothetical protein